MRHSRDRPTLEAVSPLARANGASKTHESISKPASERVEVPNAWPPCKATKCSRLTLFSLFLNGRFAWAAIYAEEVTDHHSCIPSLSGAPEPLGRLRPSITILPEKEEKQSRFPGVEGGKQPCA